MAYDLVKIAIQLVNNDLSIEKLRDQRRNRGLQISAAVVIFAFNGKFRFLAGRGEGSYQAALGKLYPDVPPIVLVHQSSERKLHKEVSGAYKCVEITPPSSLWKLIARFESVPPAILQAAAGLDLKNPKLGECIQPTSMNRSPIPLAQQVLDDCPARSSLIADSKNKAGSSYLAVLATCIVWYCKKYFLHEDTYSHFPINRIYKALFGPAFAAQYGNGIRGASVAMGLHRSYSRTILFQPPIALTTIIDEHPKTVPFVTDFIMAARHDIEKARMSFDDILPQASNTQRARVLASMISQYEKPVIMEALQMLRSGV